MTIANAPAPRLAPRADVRTEQRPPNPRTVTPDTAPAEPESGLAACSPGAAGSAENLLWQADRLLGQAELQLTDPDRPVGTAAQLADRLRALRAVTGRVADLCASTGGARERAELARLSHDTAPDGGAHAWPGDPVSRVVAAAAFTDHAGRVAQTASEMLGVASRTLDPVTAAPDPSPADAPAPGTRVR
jgi:hypothetical protein